MKAISATPVSIREVFTAKQYVIPSFQRPYTWDEESCTKLWDDIVEFYEKLEQSDRPQDEKYFLGTIVVYPEKDRPLTPRTDLSECLGVIDGQQRLTTLTLLMAAFAWHNKGYKVLNKVIRVTDRNDDATDELRLKTEVLEDYPNALSDIVLYDDQGAMQRERIGKRDASRRNNFVLFREKINEWYNAHGRDAEKLNDLTEKLLKNVVVLPIHCDSIEDALLIFEVVNNRGKPLAEADIFKSNILQKLGSASGGMLNAEQKAFLEDWKLWCKSGREDFLFKALMRIKNGQSGNIDTTDIAIKKFFLEEHTEYFEKPHELIIDLRKIYSITQWQRPHEVNVLIEILKRFPNETWKWPLISFLYAKGDFSENGNFCLSKENEKIFEVKCSEVLRHVYAKAFAGRGSQSALKGDSYKECARVFFPEDVRFKGELHLTDEELYAAKQFLQNLESESCYRTGFGLGTGIVLLCSYLISRDKVSSLSSFFDNGKIDIEHVCPKNWSNVDGWDEMTHSQLVNTLGNLIPLEKSINIQVSNCCFEKKRTGISLRTNVVPYSESLSPEAQELAKLTDKQCWLPEDVKARTKLKISLLLKFIQDA